jgi:hypothetical protein
MELDAMVAQVHASGLQVIESGQVGIGSLWFVLATAP